MEKLKLLLGGSPCTHWSIAQIKNRETEPSGIGWELFLNYKITLQKYEPDYFLYENNKSMSAAIREQISRELGVEPVLINSALVSAQSRQRLYWVGQRNADGTYSQVTVEQLEDRGILLRDILESGVSWKEKAYTLRASAGHHQGMSNILRTITSNGKFGYLGAAEPVRIGTIESTAKNADFDSQQYRVYSQDGKSVTLCGQGGGVGAKTGLYAAPTDPNGKVCPIYEVCNGQITIKGKQYPIRLSDGFYIIRKLTVTECKRLQTVPDNYVFPVSDTQAYKMLGNGWTVDVIAHIMSHFDGITTEPIEVLSMYDGMSCGHIALDKLGGHIVRYYATEIDKYAIQTTQRNFPDTIQLGDAFQVRDDGWRIETEEPQTAVTAPAAIEAKGDAQQHTTGLSNALIKYPGAKWGVADWVISHFPEHRSYLEPFFGSGAVLFTKSRSAIETVNDIDGDIVNLFDWIRKDPERLAHAIYFTPYAREEYDRAWAAQDTETDSFQRALNFYIRMMLGHGFRTTGEKVGWKNDIQGREAAYAAKSWRKTPEVIMEAAERLRGVQIENRPAVELIRRFNYPNVLIYADPPYLLSTRQRRKQYRHEMTDDEHVELLEALKAHTGPTIISGYDSDLYNRELKGWYKDGRTSFTQTASKRKEILWMNFEPVRQMDIFQQAEL